MTIEEKLKELILREYKSLRNFAPYTGLPYNTIVGILKRGVLNSNAQNVFKICKALGISADALENNEIVKVDPYKDTDLETLMKNADIARIYQTIAEQRMKASIDGKPLSTDEIIFLNDGIEIVIEQIRKKREKDK